MLEIKIHPLTIFEGPDCGGKSMLVDAVRGRTGAMAVHHGPYPQIKKRLPQLYIEAMTPMLMGYRQQAWDRCWLSEPIYGRAFRNGSDRLGFVGRRHLERIALRHGAVVVLCLPPWEAVKEKWLERKGEEYLKAENQLRAVYDGYASLRHQTDLPVVLFDYTRHDHETLWHEVDRVRPTLHRDPTANTVGCWDAKICLVGDQSSERNDDSTWLQFPFSSFSKVGCSRFLTERLEKAKIPESALFWMNANDSGNNVHSLKSRNFELIVALGQEAHDALNQAGIYHEVVNHPQFHTRFKSRDPYNLIDMIAKHLGVK